MAVLNSIVRLGRMQIILVGAILGAIFGGFTGLLIGAALGYLARLAIQQSVLGGLSVAQSQLTDSTFSIMGALCKADRVVTRDEINVVEQIFDMLRLGGEQRQAAKAAFNRGKQSDFDLDAAVDRFALLSHRRAPLLQLFLQLQCMAVAADGKVEPAEHEMLVRIARRMGLHERDVAQLEALLRAATRGPSGTGRPTSKQRVDDAYEALGISPEANPAEIKLAYRRLMNKNHPDKLAARGLPDSMRAVAEERSREINAAYDLIKEARQFK